MFFKSKNINLSCRRFDCFHGFISFCHSPETTDTLIDLTDLDAPSPPQPILPPSDPSHPFSTNGTGSPIPFLPPPPKHLTSSHGSQSSSPSHPPLGQASTSLSLLDDELLSLGINPQSIHYTDVVLVIIRTIITSIYLKCFFSYSELFIQIMLHCTCNDILILFKGQTGFVLLIGSNVPEHNTIVKCAMSINNRDICLNKSI